MGQYTEGVLTLIAGAALGERVRVKVKSGTATDPVQVEAAGAGEQHIGVTEYAAASGDPVAVRPRTMPGSKLGVAAEAFARGATLYGGANGTIQDTSAGAAIGVALEAATAPNDIVEWMDFSVLSTTAATVSVADTGGFTAATTVEAALAELYQGQKSATVTLPIPLASITGEDGTALTKQATTVIGYAQLANKEVVIMIPLSSGTHTLQFTTGLPSDIDITADLLVNVLVGKDADNDALTLDCEVYPCAAGDVANADIQDTAAQAIVAAGTVLSFTCGADGLLTSPSTVSVVLTQGGTNDQDKVYIYGAWLSYTRAILTA